jgi:2-iminobutanoate/2-iminopropanoate deaminase
MARDIIRPKSGTPPTVPLSPAVRTGNLVFVSGTPAFYGDRQIAKGDFPAQMHQVMKNIQAVLAAAGSGLHKVVKVNVILVRKSDWDDMNRIYREYFREGEYPATHSISSRKSGFARSQTIVVRAGYSPSLKYSR